MAARGGFHGVPPFTSFRVTQGVSFLQFTQGAATTVSAIEEWAAAGGRSASGVGHLCAWSTRLCAVLLLSTGMWSTATAQTFTSLVSFNGTDGRLPVTRPVQGLDGNLYATMLSGGNTNCGVSQGCGEIYKITPNGALTVLYEFCAQTNCIDGRSPSGELTLATDGNFYGTTLAGGASVNSVGPCGGNGCGTMFKSTPGGKLTTIYSFCSQSNCADGDGPSPLVQATDGNFYGTTGGGGHYGGSCGSGCGTVFKVTPSGTLTTLYVFGVGNCNIGCGSEGGLVQGNDGNFYGITTIGGGYGNGTVFKITTGGVITKLHSFSSADGYPASRLTQASDGNFYGTTAVFGPNGGGTAFKITPSGAFTLLYKFCDIGACISNGFDPHGLIQATDGNFYGTTSAGGTNNGCGSNQGCGTVFRITPSGVISALYSFCPETGCVDGMDPDGAMTQATNGKFYGTTLLGGTDNNNGTLFSLSMGLAPFVETLPTARKVGGTVRILGTNLTGATSVSFNGTSASFTVVSGSQIKTTVPTGATTGFVNVTIPSGTLKSNVAFRVLP
jgi:uncharacterized repeat protein (TIGR03803 family)